MELKKVATQKSRSENHKCWKDIVVSSLIKLGAKATTSEIVKIAKTLPSKPRKTKDWKSSVRNTLNDYCSTKEDFKRRKSRDKNHPALFVDLGIDGRERIWGLTDLAKKNIALHNFSDFPDEITLSENIEYSEGAITKILVNSYERDSLAREKCINHFGYNCSICGFNFEQKYGIAGKGFIQVHHNIPLSKIGKEYKVNAIKDLIPLCSNCHSIVHRRNLPFSIKEVKKMLSESYSLPAVVNKLQNIMLI